MTPASAVRLASFRAKSHRLSVTTIHNDNAIAFEQHPEHTSGKLASIIAAMPSRTPTLTTVALISAIAAALLALQWGYSSQSSQTCASTESVPQHHGYFEYECAGKPHQSSWGSWWHPQRTWSGADAGRLSGQSAGAVTKDWNILYHLGGNGPWVEKVHTVVEGGIAVPEGCEVEQVHMVGYGYLKPSLRS